MVELIEWYCGTANLGYDQYNRWDFPEPGDAVTPGECDCSSLVYHCAVLAGFDLPTSGTRYTGTMKRDFVKAGFEWIADAGTDNWKAGDILYKDGHTAIWTGKYIAEAYGDETGGATGGKTGDQGNETRLSPKRAGWLGYFRFPEPDPPTPDPDPFPVVLLAEGEKGVHSYSQTTAYVHWWKYNDGRLVAHISDWYNAGTGSQYGNAYSIGKKLYFPSDIDSKCPKFVKVPIVSTPCVRANQNLMTGMVSNLKSNSGDWKFIASQRAIPKFWADYTIEGFWK
jgi:hypothetical protein